MGVDAVIHGSLRRLDERVRVTIEAADPQGFVVWHDRAELLHRSRRDFAEHLAGTLVRRMRLTTGKPAASVPPDVHATPATME
jgi:hypothetical protein